LHDVWERPLTNNLPQTPRGSLQHWLRPFYVFFLKRLVKLIGGGGSSTPSVPIYKDLEGSNFVPKYKDLKG
jgi:hypothetical protein